MDRIQLPQILSDVKHKISVIEQRLSVIEEGIALYNRLQAEADNEEKAYQYKELGTKKLEERVVYTEQLKSQKHYLTEFQTDLLKQQQLRKQQMQYLKTNQQPVLDKAKELIKTNKQLSEQDKTLMRALREKFIKKQFENDEEQINCFRELLTLVKKYTANTNQLKPA